MAIFDELLEHLKSFESAPFLFIGAGFSRRYIKGPSWEELLRHYAQKCGKPYEYYRASADNNLLNIGSLIAEDFHKLWWEDPEYSRSRERNQTICNTRQSALKIAISEGLTLAELKIQIEPVLLEEIELLKISNLDGIVTTNWDSLLEKIFPDFEVYIGQDEVIFCDTQSIGEIFKIHGCSSDPNSIVLTKEDYQRFSERNVYLAAKLLTIFIEHPVLFLGYGMRDPNIIEIIRSVVKVLDGKQLEKLRDRLIFIEWNEDPSSEKMQKSEFVVDSISIPVIKITVPNFKEVFNVLSTTPRRLPVKLLRQLKQSVYELVKTTDPRTRLKVIGLDENVEPSDVEFVVGIGISEKMDIVGLTGITRDDILNDFFEDKKSWEPKNMVFEGLPVLLKRAKTTPFLKYLRLAGEINENGQFLNPDKIDERIQKRVATLISEIKPPKGQYTKYALKLSKPALSPLEFLETHGQDNFLYSYTMNEGATPEIADELLTVLSGFRSQLDGWHSLKKNGFYKLCCLYDLLKYCPGLSPTKKE